MILRAGVALLAASVLVIVGLTVLTNGQPSVGQVYAKEIRGPKVTIDGIPSVERAPQFRVRVGDSKKRARWVQVNAFQYAGCSEGDRWNGTLCAKLNVDLSGPSLSLRHAGLILVVFAMVAVPIAAAATGKRHV